MIEPIKNVKAQIVLKSGKSSAEAEVDSHGVAVKFKNPTPEFAVKVGNFLDSFMYSSATDQESTEDFAIDIFEKKE